MAPSVTLSTEGDDVLLHLAPEAPQSLAEVVARLRDDLPGLAVDWVAVREAFRYGRGRPFPVASRRPQAALDEKVKIRFSPDELSAYLLFYPPKPGGQRLSEAQVLAVVTAYGVPPALLDRRALRLALQRRSCKEPEAVARGRPATDGASAWVQWGRGWPSDPEGFVAALQVEAYPETVVAEVREGETVGRRHPPGAGTPGVSAHGRHLAPRPGADPVELGAGLTPSPDGRLVLAGAAGHLRLTGVGGRSARLMPLVRVRDGQELRALGPGIFPGSVIVEGDLEVGFPVRVLGDLEVRGSAVRTPLDVLGSLFVRDGLIGQGGGVVRVGGVASAGFYDRASVLAHTVHVRRYSMKSRLLAADRVLAPGEAALQGGQTASLGTVEAGALGSRNSLATEIIVGAPGLQGPFQEAYLAWAELARTPVAPDRDAAEPELLVAAGHWARCADTLVAPEPGSGAVRAGQVYGGVTVRIGTAVRELDAPLGATEFGYERIGPRGRVSLVRK